MRAKGKDEPFRQDSEEQDLLDPQTDPGYGLGKAQSSLVIDLLQAADSETELQVGLRRRGEHAVRSLTAEFAMLA